MGDLLNVMKPGKSVTSKQSGFNVALPSAKVASIKVISFFGDDETNEGSVCNLVEGNIDNSRIHDFYVAE